ncbi:MAG TPA: DUF1572 family protein [Verrucomicrobiae bacterium]|jgi:hypothetical protein|nr:DUF1572 family protein [Verrucomicrobiae bacterium]
MADISSFAAIYYEEVRRSFRGYKRLADGGMAQLSDPDFFHTPDGESNSVAMIVKHIAGNLRSRWTDFLTTDGEKPDRNRDQEFILAEADTRPDLMRRWEESFQIVLDNIGSLTEEDFGRTVTIRGGPHTILQAMNRSLMHTAYHVGQILFLGKYLRGSEWTSLSIPKGKSAEFNTMKPEDRKKAPNQP